MRENQEKDNNYLFSTSIDSSLNQDEFIVELFSCPEDEEIGAKPDKVIHNFDELISFFENLDEVKTSKLKGKTARLIKTK